MTVWKKHQRKTRKDCTSTYPLGPIERQNGGIKGGEKKKKEIRPRSVCQEEASSKSKRKKTSKKVSTASSGKEVSGSWKLEKGHRKTADQGGGRKGLFFPAGKKNA